ncbi:MAG: DUF1254 domain-containing protein [Alphaproteobacteria bacterium]|nr:DUF1254 domain-containing protein [Alphaproteobacteria bacterium]MCB9699187.1 DUF1254 domain-containing protein [Alphaproteobacteria bacterium]
MLFPWIIVACTPEPGESTDTVQPTPTETADTGVDDTGTPTETTTPPRRQDVVDAFLWSYPLVLSTRAASDKWVNRLVWGQDRPDETNRDAVVPNPDVLYSLAVLDLQDEPVVVHTSAMTDRYWCLQFSDYFTETFAYLGTRATGGLGGDYLVTPPGWTGTVPAGLTELPSPTVDALVVGRIHVRSDADVPTARALQANYTITPLSAWLGGPMPTPPTVPPVYGEPEDTGTNDILYWDELAATLEGNPIGEHDRAWLDRLARIGVVPGGKPSVDVTSPALRTMLESVPEATLPTIYDAVPYLDWVPQLGLGQFDDDEDLIRAAVAYDGWITHRPEEAVYAVSRRMDGSLAWNLHFDRTELPPVDAFWSLTVYGDDRYMVPNPFHQYSVQSTDPRVVRNRDGSLDIRMQPTFPGSDGHNWIPTPDGELFYVILRMYLPQGKVLSGAWQPPEIMVEQAGQ